ncbi:9601_t:CDS:2 [Acaulospora morrowiae]|uniref:9601_t:CDS:1 n=1 Tax=Acaulospora morrowiae TaxID=94023 RepID=A0A9N9NA83_9GLOM|nr:9601_t:CDS:2 [Acaulospora morrowiae]
MVIATCVIVNVKGFSGLGQSNIFFQFVNRIVIVVWAFVLILSEIGWPKRIHKWFPILDDSHSWWNQQRRFLGLQVGVSSVSVFLPVIYIFVLTKDHIPSSLHEFIIIPGWFVFVIGIIYVLLGSFGGASLKADRRIV